MFWLSVRLTSVSSWTADTPRPPAGRCQTAATPRQSRPKDLWPTRRRRLSSDLPVRFSHNDEHESFLSPTFPKHFETWPRQCKQLANTPQPEVAEANLICATPKRVGFLWSHVKSSMVPLKGSACLQKKGGKRKRKENYIKSIFSFLLRVIASLWGTLHTRVNVFTVLNYRMFFPQLATWWQCCTVLFGPQPNILAHRESVTLWYLSPIFWLIALWVEWMDIVEGWQYCNIFQWWWWRRQQKQQQQQQQQLWDEEQIWLNGEPSKRYFLSEFHISLCVIHSP